MGIKMLKPGLLTTIQDKGRTGHQKEGVIVSGAMDRFALRVANLLVGNREEAAALEITMLGPQINFESDQLIAITGADLSPRINGEPVQLWRPILVKKGCVLDFGAPQQGCRAYLALAGSFDIPLVMGSKSTYLRAQLGGLHGKALQAGDVIPVGEPSQGALALIKSLKAYTEDRQYQQAGWSLHPTLYGIYANSSIRAVKGPEYELFSVHSKQDLWLEPYLLSAQSDRMGYRLEGVSLALSQKVELISSGVTFGTVQVPADGNPIVLMADHQTTGGYPRIAQVISADLPKLAQLIPGQAINFKEVSLKEAQLLYFAQEQKMEWIKQALHLKLSVFA